jgi:glycosyltransferase involved in cell wall biosynthesis
MIKVAFLLPSLSNNGPIIVAKDIINTIVKISPDEYLFTVFYFDDIVELKFNCKTIQISFKDQISFDDFDIVHSHGFRPDKYIYKNRKHISAKVISTIHCDVYEDLKHSYNSLISKVFGRVWIHYLDHLDKVVTLTNYHKDFYSKYISREKISVINNGRGIPNQPIEELDREFFDSLRKRNPGKTIIASFAGLSSRKGLDQIIKALPSLKNFLYVIIGDGDQKSKLLKLSRECQVSDRCFFLGYRKEASRYLNYVDIFAIPSHSEAFPLSLIEATLHGISCVCSDIPVLTEVFTEKEVTFFHLDDIRSLIKAISLAADDRESKGKNSQIKANQQFTAEKMALNYQVLYNSIAK